MEYFRCSASTQATVAFIVCQHGQASDAMLTYTSAELRSLAGHTQPPPRNVRKTLFTFRLWRPRRLGMRSVPRPTARRPAPGDRSADSPSNQTLRVGWLNAQSLRNKTDAVNTGIVERSLDVLAVTETWHTASDDNCLRLATPPGYAVVDVARSSRRGGGVAVIFRQGWRCIRLSTPACRSFEVIAVRLVTDNGPLVVVNLYRPGSESPTSLFFDELSALLETLVILACPVVIGGDFNVPVQNATDAGTRRLTELLASFDIVQHVVGPTHRHGNTLDLVLTQSQFTPLGVDVEPAGMFSDHSLVVSQLPFAVAPATIAERLVRGWRRVDRSELRRIIEESELSRPPPEVTDVDQLFATYDTIMRGIADRLAPVHRVRRRRGRLSPWFDAECRSARRECRRLERRYRKSRSVTDRLQWIDATRRRFDLHRRKKESYWQERLLGCGRSPSSLWRSLSSLLGRDRQTSSATDHTADGFATFFARKIAAVRSDTAGLPPPPVFVPATSSLASFRPCTESDVRRIIMSSPVKSSSLDPIPTFLVREFIDILLPYITKMVNSSLAAGRLPTSQKHAIVTPLLKKPGLDTADMGNYRPVSNLSFMSKVVERVVASQLNDYLVANNLLPRFQSAYRKWHSTETAMLQVWSDFLKAADVRHVTLLSLLDMSAAFDCVDHSILLQRLRSTVGLSGVVLDWIDSFLSGRTQQISYNGQLSAACDVLFGVPQGSVLGPLLYILYTAELAHVVARHGLSLHQYADDCQVYISSPVDDAPAAVDQLSTCLVDVEAWLKASRLRLNPAKTQVMWLGSQQLLSRLDIVDVSILSSDIRVQEKARDLGVVIDSRLSLSDHVASVCRSGYYQLRQLRPVVRCSSEDATKTLVQAFIASRLDYCNVLYYGIYDELIRRLQSVQNAAARLVTGTRRSDHISPVLRQLHWLPVRQRVVFKVATLVYQSLCGHAPSYLVDDCQLVTDVRARKLRSADTRTLAVNRTCSSFGDRTFAAAATRVWNSLPPDMRKPELSYGQFRRSLKTFLFGQ